MKKLLISVFAAASLIIGMNSCDDTTSTIGSSLVSDQVEIVIDSTYTLTGYSVPSGNVPARTILQLLGSIDAEGYGRFSSDVVTQFFPMEMFDTTGVTAEQIDSVKMIMRIPNGAYVGDSLIPMGLTVYPLTRQLPWDIRSDFDPTDYYNPNATPLCSTTYTLTAAGYQDKANIPYRYVNFDIDPEFGRTLYNKYKESPSTFSTPQNFAEYFPGVYIKNTFGNGRVMQVDSTVVTMYYRQKLHIDSLSKDTVLQRSASYLAVAPEILTNNNIQYTVSPLIEEIVARGVPLMAAPIGYDVETTFPGRELVASYRAATNALALVNTLALTIPVEKVANDYGITPPTYILMVLKKDKDNFFLQSKLPDDKTSFYATYNPTLGQYEFNDMRAYMQYLLDKDEIKDEDVEFIITPVTLGWQSAVTATTSYYYYTDTSTTAQYTLATVSPYINRPTLAILQLEKAKIKFTYSRQSL